MVLFCSLHVLHSVFLFTENCDCERHSNVKKVTLPWMPVPGLLPISKPSTSVGSPSLRDDMMSAQIKINANVMKELEAMRKERSDLLAANARALKERDVYKNRLDQTSEQLNYLKKKMVNRTNENEDPNAGSVEASA